MTEEQKKKTMKRRRCCESSQQRHLSEDMIFEILLRLSTKSLCRFQCVSRLWGSMIQSPLFVSAHGAQWSAIPKLLLCQDNLIRRHVFSTAYPIPSPENKLVEDASGCWCSHGRTTAYISVSEAGLICSYDDDRKDIHVTNLTTGERISPRTLPFQIDYEGKCVICFGYDPVENKHKVLVVQSESWETIPTVNIFTVGGAEAWRRIINPTGLPRIILFSWLSLKRMSMRSICLDGTIYIIGMDKMCDSWLVAFDVRTETFRAVPVLAEAGFCTSVCLLCLGGAPAFIDNPNVFQSKGEGKFRLWILDDFRRQLWSCREFLVPFSYPVELSGITSRGEVILSHIFPSEGSSITLLTLYFFQLENSTIKTMEIPGYRLNAGRYLTAFYHIEDMRPLRDHVSTYTTSLRTEVLSTKLIS